MQDSFFSLYDDGVASIVSALKSNHRIDSIRQHVDYFTFTLITPLRADYYDGPTHTTDLVIRLVLRLPIRRHVARAATRNPTLAHLRIGQRAPVSRSAPAIEGV